MLKKQQQIDKKVEQTRIAKKQKEIRLTIFACRRCFVKFSSNTKFHEHIRDHHTKKSKFVVSSSFIFSISSFTSFYLTIFLFDSSKFASQSKTLSIFFTFSISIFSSFSSSKRVISSKFSFLSNSASEFVSKHSENTIICSFIFSFIFQKFATMRSIFLYNLFSKLYLTIDDLFRMFVEKSKSINLQQHQKHQFFSRIFDISKRNFTQMRIIFYFLSISKSRKFEIFILMYDSIKQSTRTSFQRFFSSRFFFSIRFLFSTIFYFFLFVDVVKNLSSSICLAIDHDQLSQKLKCL